MPGSRNAEQAPLCIASTIKNQGEINADIQLPNYFFPSYSFWTLIHDMMTLTFSVDHFPSINFSGNILTTHTHRFIP